MYSILSTIKQTLLLTGLFLTDMNLKSEDFLCYREQIEALILPKQYPEEYVFLKFVRKNSSACPLTLVCLGTPVSTALYLYICSVRSKVLLPLTVILRRLRLGSH